jgi:hypothetical protein
MARSFLGKTKEAVGVMPAMGMKVAVEEIERTETGENSATPGALMYVGTLRVLEPEQFKGATLRDWFLIGTKDDKRAKREETWRRSEGGPGRLVRMLKRAGVATSDDDEEWMEGAQGAEVCITVLKQRDRETGEWRNRVGLYFREEDEDFVGVGETLEADEDGPRRGRGAPRTAAKAAGKGPVSARGRAKAEEDEDEEEEKPKASKAKKPAPDDDDEEDEGDEDEEAPPRARAAAKVKSSGKAKRPSDDDDDDED